MRNWIRAALLSATILSPGAALAQAAPTGAAPAAEAKAGDDIIVTARKRAESIQDAPIAITAYNSADIKSARIENLADVAKLTPGLNYTPLFGRQNQLPIIRGAAQTFGQLNVGVFLDGIYLSGKGGVDLALNDLERIEVIKGPQSALYGRNTFAGAINYVTRRPSAVLGGNAEATAGSNGLYKAQASISGPLGNTLRFRVGGFYNHFDGFYRSAIDGGRVDFEKDYGGLITVEWQPDPTLTFTLRASYSKEDDGQPASNVIHDNAAPGTPAGSAIAGVFTPTRNLLYLGEVPEIPINGVTVNTAPVPGLPGGSYGDREETFRTSLVAEKDLGTVTGTWVTSFSRRNAEYTYDGDNTFCNLSAGCPNFGYPFAPAIPSGKSDFGFSSSDGYYRDVSQEIRLASNPGGKIDWLAGLFYYSNITNTTDRGFTPTSTLAISSYTAAAANYTYPQTVLRTNSYSAFGSFTWHATEQLSLTGELRYETEDQTFDQAASRFINPLTGTAVTAGSTATFHLAQKFHFWTPRAIINYKISPDAMIYASYARGAKTGGFNTGLNVFDNQRAYFPEYANNYELGLKTDLLDRRVRFNVAGYYIDWNDQQAACQNPVSAGGSSTNRTYTCNVAASTIYGGEVELSAKITDYFTLAANYSYTHARYDAFVDDSLAQTLVLAGLPAIAFKDKHLPYVPDHKIVVSPRFTLPLGALNVEARADVQYQSRTFLRADNLQSFGDKTVVDLRLTTRLQNFSLQLFANNVFDNKVPVAGVRFFDSVNYSVSSPLVQGPPRRELGATLGYRF